jgi:crotonobetaine/carnitine-CoA ligase
VHLCVLPLFHTNALAYSSLAALWAGATVVLQPRFSASRFWSAALDHRCTWAIVTRFVWRALGAHEVPRDHQFRLWGNAWCEPPTDAEWGVKTIGWWGMTETISHGIVGDVHLPNRPMSMGRPAAEYGIAVRHADGSPVGPGETGDLFVRGTPGLSLFAGYLDDPAATAAAYTDDGWFTTGDRVTLHDDGFLSFADRTKDMLRVGGENVAASEIERVIAAVAGVDEAAVVGQPHPMLDEVPVAFVIPAGGRAVAPPTLAADIAAACAAGLADFKRPRHVVLVDELPRATLGKVAKNVLRTEAAGLE